MMIPHLLRVVVTLLLAAACIAPVRAQFVNNPGTGCAGAMTWAGTPTIGTTPIMHAPCAPGVPCVLVIGTPIPCFNVVPLCPSCPLCCSLTATVVFVSQSVPLPIPNNTGLIGVTGCMQIACFTTANCFKTSDWLTFTIQ